MATVKFLHTLRGFAICLLIGAALPAAEPTALFPRVPPVEPAKAADTFRTLDGFRMDLIAAEPLVTDPVAMAYDEDGRAYVAEMNDYPYTDPKTHQAFKENTTDAAIGKIRLLVDTDGDGVFDKSTIFVEGLSWPTGIACYKSGIFVAATPDLWYFKDTDGDGKADVKTKVLTGFKKMNVQAVMNNLIWGLDNCIYGAGGTNGGSITPANEKNAKPVTLTRNDFRFDPATHKFEAIAGGARFGNTFDDWGNRFICNIRNPAQHVVLENRYLARNPYLTVPSTLQDVAESGDALPAYRISPPELWRDVRARRWSTERNSNQPRSELVAAGVVTSSSGITIYRGDAYPPEFRSQFFIGEVAGNLVHRQQLVRNGVTFTSHRIDEKKEFVASTDVWFRPVNFVNAPDGTLHVLDMYREVIEHPWSIPDDIRARLDLRSGADRGRIYRLSPPGFKVPKPPRLSKASTAELVKTLEHPNAWWRETAQRLLVERQDKDAIKLLRDLQEHSEKPLARLHAMWTLEGLGAEPDEHIRRGLTDISPGVRVNALRIAERHSKDGKWKDGIWELFNDMDPAVRFQAALSIGELSGAGTLSDLISFALRDIHDPWMVVAILSSASTRAGSLLVELRDNTGKDETEFLRRLAIMVGARNDPNEISRVLSKPPDTTLTSVNALTIGSGLSEGLRRHRKSLRDLATDDTTDSGKAAGRLLSLAYRIAADHSASDEEREAATRLIGFDDFNKAKSTLNDLLDSHQPPPLQHAALTAVASANHPDAGPMLLAKWNTYTPALRTEVVQAMLGYRNRIPLLLDAVEAGKVAAHDIPSARRAALLKDKDPAIAARAEKLFGSGAGDRQAAIEKYLPALNGKGDPAAGQKIYEANCSTCHRLGDKGFDVGPNLATVRQWGPEQLLVNILDPGREIAPQFSEYVVELTDGQSLSGVVADESPTSLTLRWAGGGQRVISRADIRKIFATRASPMPEGLESAISPQQMVDLIAFLRKQEEPRTK